MVDDLLAERRRARPRSRANRSRASRSVAGHARLVGRVGVALERAARARAPSSTPCRPAAISAAQRQVRVDVGARRRGSSIRRRGAVADDAQRARAVVVAPGDRGRRERARGEALVGVDVRRVAAASARAGTASWPARKRSNSRVVVGEHGRAVLAPQREVDVARVALALVELGHEGDRHALLGGDLLGAVLVDRVLVGGRAARGRSGS